MKYDKDLIYKQLKELRENAYAPYSNFRVACLVFLKNGEVIKGVNVENAAYNPGICAERCALPQVYAQGYTKKDVELVALYTDSKEFGSPCGTCRQTMSELLVPKQSIWVYNSLKYLGEYTVEDFLPYMFTSDQLKD